MTGKKSIVSKAEALKDSTDGNTQIDNPLRKERQTQIMALFNIFGGIRRKRRQLPSREVYRAREAGGSSGGQITQANVQQFVVKAVGNTNEGADGDFTSSSYDLAEIKEAVTADSLLKLAVAKYSQLIFKAGYTITSDNDAAAEYLRGRFRMMSFMQDTPMDILFQQVADDLVMYSNAFLAKSRTDMTNIGGLQAKGLYDPKPVGGYFRLDPATVQIKVDKYGQIKQYQQEVGQNTAKFKPTDIIHIYVDKQGGELFGTPRVVAALEDVKILRKVEGETLTLIYRYAIPLYQMKIGLPEQGFMATDREIDEAKKEVQKLANDGLLVTNERTEFISIGAEGAALDTSKYLEYWRKRVLSVLHLSEAQVGSGGAKQDADSMEEQAHDLVKWYQHAIQTFIENKMLNELLIEGGYNPYMNEQDICHFTFNEINNETQVKMQTHWLNMFQGNLVTIDEARQGIGFRSDNIDESRLYQNMIQTPAQLALVNAKVSATGSGSANTGTSGPSKTSSSGAQKNTASKVQPSNQHGTTSMKVKESMNLTESTKDNVSSWKKNFPSIYKKYSTMRNDVVERGSKSDVALPLTKDSIRNELISKVSAEAGRGAEKAIRDSHTNPDQLRDVPMSQLTNYIDKTLNGMFKDIKKRLKKAEGPTGREEAFNAVEYRLRFLCEKVLPKAYWFGYAKACAYTGIKKIYVDFGKSDDAEKYEKVVHTKDFTIDEIPAFHAYCTCRLSLEDGGEE